ncbi:WYL domain-containing protein [Flavobacterium sp. Sd200]|uniref:helix-turn-helix transcriptional regulator n=1 Tax=Flavobacterium sp. Sd200 TaxID=2692211 RepID=UPI00136F7D06|nr:WYL domain-containing protein [Flavobacterium sp. Sd200]MXN90524.1 WYL domain-containing protein [Flavobacterium sp. Sd200]
MSQNKNALIRYKTIDKCLQNKYRQWTLDDLIEACSNALYEYEGKQNNVSRRTIQMDIQLMRSEKLGYNAPIVVYDKKFYRYEDEEYTITNIPITETDINVLTETVSMLKQFKDFSLFNDVSDILQRLEDKIYAEKEHTNPVIYLDKNENLKGLHFLDTLYQAIIKKVVVVITYQSFKSSVPNKFEFCPYILKEYNNRWFLVGKRGNSRTVSNLALDRIINVDFDFNLPYNDFGFEADDFYKDVIGVTVNEGLRTETVQLWVDAANAPYVITKPFHSSQQTQQQNEDGSIVVSLKLKLNQELERIILGFGEGIKVVAPQKLQNRIKYKLTKALKNYDL